jgi:hypothetical protein
MPGLPLPCRVLTGVVAVVLVCAAADAQVRQRALKNARVDEGRGTLTVEFNAPVNVSSHTPREEGRFLRVVLQLVRGAPLGGPPVRESLRAKPTASVPVSDIVYQLEPGLTPTLELSFTRSARFSVRQGSDARSVVVAFEHEEAATRASPVAEPAPRTPQQPAPVLSDRATAPTPPPRTPRPAATVASDRAAAPAPAPPTRRTPPPAAPRPALPYVVNLMSTRRPVDLADLDLKSGYRDLAVSKRGPGEVAQVRALSDGRELALYRVEFGQAPKLWHRVRLGFFPTRAAAQAIAVQLRAHFPDAWVAQASDAERARHGAVPGARPSAPEPVAAPPAVEPTTAQPATAQPATQPPAAPAPERRAQRPAEADVPRVALTAERQEALISEGRDAMTARDYRTAIRVFGKLQRDGDDAARKEAQELLGLARERNGQLAQAKAEYETYLERYPEGEDAERVRQRLQGLLTARRPDQEPLRQLSREAGGAEDADWRVFGSLSQFYRNLTRRIDGGSHDVVLSSLPTDLSVSASLQTSGYDLRADFTGGHDQDFLDSSDSETTISTLSVYGEQLDWGLSVELGRQTRSSGGVLGRFDGGVLSYAPSGSVRLNGVFGYPVLRTSDTSVNTDEYFYGLSAELSPVAGNWDFVVSAIEQRVDDLVVRRALGGEARYFEGGRSLFVLADYDIKFNDLNTLLALGTWLFDNGASINVSLDRRKSPILTVNNALQGLIVGGVPITTIPEAREIFTDEELRQLALERDTTITTGTLGGTYPLSEKLQLTGDITATHTSDTLATFDPRIDGGVIPGTSGTGVDVLYNLQLIASNVFKPGDIGIAGVRFSDLNVSNVYSLNLNARYPVTDRLRLNPRVDVIYRDNERDSGERYTVRPEVRVEYRPSRRSRFEVELLYEWLKDRRPEDVSLLRTYGLNVGYRLDF